MNLHREFIERAGKAIYTRVYADEKRISKTEIERRWKEKKVEYCDYAEIAVKTYMKAQKEDILPETTVDVAILVIDEYLRDELDNLQAALALNECINLLQQRSGASKQTSTGGASQHACKTPI